jgi:putative endonuclease
VSNKTTGDRGEQAAANFLRGKGYTILATNWRSGHKEIDLIADDCGRIVFVEVKTRSTASFGYPEEAVTQAKQQKIASAAYEWIMQNRFGGEIRFDIIAILRQQDKTMITHFTDAFAP